ncbi:hypothetical protein C357_19985 [Citreicella sp. 357]|nr:hypothetical protein C357_19985 [Citreicella sp. 357]
MAAIFFPARLGRHPLKHDRLHPFRDTKFFIF